MEARKDNRVLGRLGARLLTAEELASINGGATTNSACTFFLQKQDGECPNP